MDASAKFERLYHWLMRQFVEKGCDRLISGPGFYLPHWPNLTHPASGDHSDTLTHLRGFGQTTVITPAPFLP